MKENFTSDLWGSSECDVDDVNNETEKSVSLANSKEVKHRSSLLYHYCVTIWETNL